MPGFPWQACAVILLATPLAAQSDGLPTPLSLEDALAFAKRDRPVLELARADRDVSAAALAEVDAISGVRLSAVGELRAVRPSHVSDDRDSNDSSARLALRKRLYDFGYTEALSQSARKADVGSEWRYRQARQQAHLAVMRRFLDVILADLQFARDNEAMATAFIDVDRARDRHALGRVSDVELLRLDAAYQDALQMRSESQSLQRAARARLAIAMGRPDELASDLIRPTAPDIAVPLPDYEDLLAEILAGNPEVKALRAEVEAAEAAVAAARADYGPVVSGELAASVHNRGTSSTHPLGAALVLEVPLLTGGAKDATIATARAELRGSRARLQAHEHALRERVLVLWQRFDHLRSRLRGLKVRGDFRELYLDRSRALYELEVKTDLGDAMTEISALRLDEASAEFDWMMARAKLAALAGRLLPREDDE